MTLTPKQKKGGAFVIAGVFGIITGQFVSPEIFAELLEAIM